MDKRNEKVITIIVCVLLSFSLWVYRSNVQNVNRTVELKNISVTIENAKRMAVAHLLTYPDNFISDQCLYEIGQYDPNTAKIEGYDSKVLVAGSKGLLEKVYQLRKEYEEYKKEALDEFETLKKLQKGKEAK